MKSISGRFKKFLSTAKKAGNMMVEKKMVQAKSKDRLFENLKSGKLVTIDELLEYFRHGIKKQTIYSWIHYRKMPRRKIGRKVFFNLDDVEVWLTQEFK